MSEFQLLDSLKQMKAAIRIWTLSLQVNKAIVGKKLDLGSLPRVVSLRSGSSTELFDVTISLTSYGVISRNTVLACTGICAIAFDEAMDQTFGKKNSEFPTDDADLTAARAIIYQIRNAFAHGPSDPRWKVTNKKYLSKKLRIADLNLEIDFGFLNNKNFTMAQIGGWKGYLDLLLFCIRWVEQHKGGKIEAGIQPRE